LSVPEAPRGQGGGDPEGQNAGRASVGGVPSEVLEVPRVEASMGIDVSNSGKDVNNSMKTMTPRGSRAGRVFAMG